VKILTIPATLATSFCHQFNRRFLIGRETGLFPEGSCAKPVKAAQKFLDLLEHFVKVAPVDATDPGAFFSTSLLPLIAHGESSKYSFINEPDPARPMASAVRCGV